MKTLKEIKEEVALEYDWVDWICFLSDCPEYEKDFVINEVARRYAIEVAKESLKNASENANIMDDEGDLCDRYYDSEIDTFCFVNKQSILNENNIPRL